MSNVAAQADQTKSVGWEPLVRANVQNLTFTQIIYLTKEIEKYGAHIALREIIATLAASRPGWLYPPQTLVEILIKERAEELFEKAPAILHSALVEFGDEHRMLGDNHWSTQARDLLMKGAA